MQCFLQGIESKILKILTKINNIEKITCSF